MDRREFDAMAELKSIAEEMRQEAGDLAGDLAEALDTWAARLQALLEPKGTGRRRRTGGE